VSYDLIITNGRVIDGSGNPWFKADVGIKDGKIQTVGHIATKDAEILDAAGMVTCPGFIDMHTHSDLNLLVNPLGESKIRQGGTIEVIGLCGGSLAPLTEAAAEEFEQSLQPNIREHVDISWRTMAECLQQFEAVGLGINVLPLVGFGTIRKNVLQFENRAPTAEELDEMKAYVQESMEAGVFGLSTGLSYTPQPYATMDEIVALCRVVHEYQGLYVTHVRGETDMIVEAIAEAIETGRQSGCPVQISHFKAAGKANWGKTKITCEMVEAARAEGLDVTVDMYPYTAGWTMLTVTLPKWVYVGGLEKAEERLRDPATREKIKHDIANGIPGWEHHIKAAGYDGIFITDFAEDRSLQGKYLSEIAQMRGDTDPADTVMDLLLESNFDIQIIWHMMEEADVQRVLTRPFMGIGSDAGAVAPYGPLSEAKTHPRAYGTFARFLGPYVREKKVVSLPEAIRKMTSFGAQRFGLQDRGLLKEGFVADVVVFDPQAIRDVATYEDPHQYAVGIEYVILNGQVVIAHGEHTQVRVGHVLKRTGL
jgi:N-acyl-D-amino-acid deacylase